VTLKKGVQPIQFNGPLMLLGSAILMTDTSNVHPVLPVQMVKDSVIKPVLVKDSIVKKKTVAKKIVKPAPKKSSQNQTINPILKR